MIENKRAYFDYEIIEKLEAGLELRGFEVKAIRAGKASIVGSRVIIRGGEAFLVGTIIQPYQANNLPNNADSSDKPHRLLLNTREINHLDEKSRQGRLTIVPLKVYNSHGRLKIEIALVRGKKRFDKRESIKKRDTKRQIDRTLKNRD